MSTWIGSGRAQFQVVCTWDGHKPPWHPAPTQTSQRWIELGPSKDTFEEARTLANDLRMQDGYARVVLKQWVEQDGVKLQEVYQTPTGAPLCKR